ncbi:TonB-dependent receptor [bacterium]|nr:MAG: TonB-dependent receptor [bacterium]
MIRTAFLALLFVVLAAAAAVAASAAFIGGTVVGADGKPVPSASVTLEGNNMTATGTTDAAGRFAFSGLAVGTYTLAARTSGGEGVVQVDLGSQGATVTIGLLKVVGSVRVLRTPSIAGSGTDIVLNQTQLARSPAGGSLPGVLLQLPGAARGANGVVHINGDHGDINYVVDGVPVPQELNRQIGSEIDPSDISFMDVLEGAYPAQYGGRFAAVVNINTRVGNGPPGFDGSVLGGSYGHLDSRMGYHAPLGAGSLVVDVRNEQSDRALDPPNFAAVHDRGGNANQFVRYTLPRGRDFWDASLSHSYQAFQIPSDVAGGQPVATDDSETQDDAFLNLQYHHALRGDGALTYGVAFKRSRIRDSGDPANDIGYSLSSDRTSRDVTLDVDDVVRSARHEIRAGALYDAANVQKIYRITLQVPGAASTVTDDAPNVGHTESAYLQDAWRMGPRWRLDYGLRWDGFQVFSTEFDRGFSQVSPRVKLTRLYGSRGAVYLYAGRFFTPFSLENVSPTAARELNVLLQPTLAPFDLKPQRDTDLEIGGHLPLGPGELGLRVAQKSATDLIDDTQVGTTALHQDINYARGSISTQSASYQQPLRNGGRVYLSVTRTRAVNQGCETQLLAPCFGSSTDWTPADHDQRWSASGGVLRNDARGGWLSLDGEYGSGLSSSYCRPASDGCKVPPHLTFDVQKGIAIGPAAALTVGVLNVFNDRYLITYLNAQGNHYAAGRVFELGFRFRTR